MAGFQVSAGDRVDKDRVAAGTDGVTPNDAPGGIGMFVSEFEEIVDPHVGISLHVLGAFFFGDFEGGVGIGFKRGDHEGSGVSAGGIRFFRPGENTLMQIPIRFDGGPGICALADGDRTIDK